MINQSDINAPHVSIERKGNDLLIHVSAKENERAPNGLIYRHDFSCTFVYGAAGRLWRRGPYKYGEPRWGAPQRVVDTSGAVRSINAYLCLAAGRAWW